MDILLFTAAVVAGVVDVVIDVVVVSETRSMEEAKMVFEEFE